MTSSVVIRVMLYCDRRGSKIGELSVGCLRWEIGPCVITHRQRNANWTLDWSLSSPWLDGLSGFSHNRTHPLSLYIVKN